MFVAFSCQQRCLCPSCHQKRTLLTAETIAQTICGAVRHDILEFSARVLSPHRPQRTQFHPID
jgi:transposase-like protein